MIRKIAPEHVRRLVAGQLVVEASAVVRELVENSIDAGATAISLKISKDFSDIEIKDNGCGISKEDRLVIGEAHATSKIESFEDIYDRAANSYGFRGEAIYLIMSSCETMTIMSKTASEQTGEILKFKNGVRQPPEIAAFPAGTTIKVCRVFARYPTREKLLATKGAAEEASKVTRMLLAYCLLYPKLRVVCDHPRQQKLPDTSLVGCITSLFGPQCLQQLAHIDWTAEGGDYAVSGFWPKIHCDLSVSGVYRSRMNDRMFVFVNHRVALIKFAEKLVIKKWRASCLSETTGKYPFVVLMLKIPTFSYDVNVAPDKRTFLFKNEDMLRNMISSALDASLEMQKEVDSAASSATTASSTSSTSPAIPLSPTKSFSVFARRPPSPSLSQPSLSTITTTSPSSSNTSEETKTLFPTITISMPSSLLPRPPPRPSPSRAAPHSRAFSPPPHASAPSPSLSDSSSSCSSKTSFPAQGAVPLSSFDPLSPLCVTGGPLPSVPLSSLPVAVFKASRRQTGRYSPKSSSASFAASELSLSQEKRQREAEVFEQTSALEYTQKYDQKLFEAEEEEDEQETDRDMEDGKKGPEYEEDEGHKRSAEEEEGVRKKRRRTSTDRASPPTSQTTVQVTLGALASALAHPLPTPKAFSNEIIGCLKDNTAMLLADGQLFIRTPMSPSISSISPNVKEGRQLFPFLYLLNPRRALELLKFKRLCLYWEPERLCIAEGDILIDDRFSLTKEERARLFEGLSVEGETQVEWSRVLRQNGFEVRIDAEEKGVYLCTFPVEGDLDQHHLSELVRLLLAGKTRFGTFRPNDVMDMLRDMAHREIDETKDFSVSMVQNALDELGCIVSASKTVVCPHNQPLVEKISLPACLNFS